GNRSGDRPLSAGDRGGAPLPAGSRLPRARAAPRGPPRPHRRADGRGRGRRARGRADQRRSGKALGGGSGESAESLSRTESYWPTGTPVARARTSSPRSNADGMIASIPVASQIPIVRSGGR